ncbi:translation initiation factor IF-3 [Arthrobacter echini]|uniref:Translation initiation factor IF-3 n=1 Tax=Arthrobacter echini TaxID=1529066 RepID=A0A4S5E0S4_9MICC|nr:translation initiation factor IF-3 [Arthrobacter echini]THJ64911.1 translation initiation factor IF-3 [Arthrobacter echini]
MGGLLSSAGGSSSKHSQESHISEPRINDRIRVPEVRLVGPAGEQVGIVRIEDALRLAAESDLDLVEVAPQAKPPVAKLMDFGKYKYEAAVKAREARKNQTNTVLKEIRFRLKIDTHDYETKRGHALRFLGAGDKVKAMIQFRGREQQRPEMGIRLLQKFAEDVSEVGVVESTPRIDGRNMVMVIGPTKNKAEAKAEARRATQRADAKAANEAARSGDEPARVQTSASGNAPMTQSLADLLPEGYSIRSEPDAPAENAQSEESSSATPAEETTQATTAGSEAPAQQATAGDTAPAAASSRPAVPRSAAPRSSAPRSSAPRSSEPRSTAPRSATERPAASRPAAPAPRTTAAAPSSDGAAPKPAAAAKPTPAPKPGAPKPSAMPKPGARTPAPRSTASRPKPDSTDQGS